jgi:hypothetical protein
MSHEKDTNMRPKISPALFSFILSLARTNLRGYYYPSYLSDALEWISLSQEKGN